MQEPHHLYEARGEIEVLRGICHAFGSSGDVAEAAAATVRWMQEAVGSPDASIRLDLQDESGRLREVAGGGRLDVSGRLWSGRRDLAFRTKRAFRSHARAPGGRGLAVLPLVSRGESVGTIEVVASRRALEERWGTIEAVASQAAIVFRNLSQRADLQREVAVLRDAAALARDLVGARDPRAAVAAALQFCFERFRAPVAGWVTEGVAALVLAGARGLGPARQGRLEAEMGTIPRWSPDSAIRRERVIGRFARIAGTPAAAVTDAGAAVLLVGAAPASVQAALDVIGSLVRQVLDHLAAVALALRRNERLDLGIAWTAHELREPLLSAKAAVERVLSGGEPGAGRELLRRSCRELERLADLVDALLQWSVGASSVRRRPTDLARLVREVVAACELESGQDRVSVLTPPRVVVPVDGTHLRGAIANLVRNALAYSPPSTEVRVSVDPGEDVVRVTVEDQGPGVPPSDREAIFDPFVRGRAARGTRSGRGLGLFIARRVVEAHGGAIWVGSNGRGAAFHIELPITEGGGHPGPHR